MCPRVHGPAFLNRACGLQRLARVRATSRPHARGSVARARRGPADPQRARPLCERARRYAAPQLYVMSTQTPAPPPAPVAALLSPVLWRMETPDRFDM